MAKQHVIAAATSKNIKINEVAEITPDGELMFDKEAVRQVISATRKDPGMIPEWFKRKSA